MAKCTDIEIKPADKGGAIVIMSRTDYTSEVQIQLNDETFYKCLDCDPTTDFKAIVEDTIKGLVKAKKLSDNAVG